MDINDAWKNTCRVIFGEEIGDLDEFSDYLTKYVEPIYEKKSCISGKPTVISSPFPERARFISNDETDEYNRMMENLKLDINEIKDIDSILGALKDKLYYSGNIVVGNSRNVQNSDSCGNVSFVYKSIEIYDSKYVAYSSFRRFDEFVFGSTLGGESKFVIKGFGNYRNRRCMGTLRTFTSSDCYYTANLEDCTNCMFSFNQKSKHNLIGNLQLPPDEYSELKNKLIREMRDTLKEKKEIPTIVEVLGGGDE
ncbi:MAG: hypothetical protein ABIG39_04150 [Candidatus Micrarchaeota archaeon]